jgi:carbonic anhydrase
MSIRCRAPDEVLRWKRISFHMNHDGKLAVLGVLLEPGGRNDAFSAVIKSAPPKAGGEVPTGSVVNPRIMIPVRSIRGAMRTR